MYFVCLLFWIVFSVCCVADGEKIVKVEFLEFSFYYFWGTLGCIYCVTPGRYAGKFDLNVLIIEQRNLTFKQERGFTKGKTATSS